MGSLTEVLHSFSLLFKDEDLENVNTPDKVMNDIDFIKSEEVINFKKDILKRLRDKSVYHTDKIVIEEYANEIKDKDYGPSIYKLKVLKLSIHLWL